MRVFTRILLCLCLFLAATGFESYAQLNVSNSMTPEDLVNVIFVGNNAIISNVTYSGAPEAIGSFTAGTTNLGIQEGILLTTGSIYNAIGPNKDTMTTKENHTPGDPDLDKVYGIPVLDAAVLEFDFMCFADRVTFEYVFASEEYPEYVGSIYNDTFGFFISGPGYVGNENIAFVPDSYTPVSINTVNHQMNPQHYIDNTKGATIEYDGFTKLLLAEALVVPCMQYHLKLAIADAGDFRYDSGVFLKAKSFESGSSVYIAQTKNAVEGCGMGYFMIVRIGRIHHPITYKYDLTGTAINGVDFSTLSGSVFFESEEDTAFVYVNAFDDHFADVPENVVLSLKNNCGSIVDSDTLSIGEATGFIADLTSDTAICHGDYVSMGVKVYGGTGPFGYAWIPDNLPMPNVKHRPDTSTTYIVSIIDSSSGCIVTDTVHVNVYELGINAGPDVFICPLDSVEIGGFGVGGKPPFRYEWEPKVGLSSDSDPRPRAFPKTTTDYVVRVTDALGCMAYDSVKVEVSTLAVETTGDRRICSGGSVRVAAMAAGGLPPFRYKWTPSEGVSDTTSDSPVLSPQFTTVYRVTITDEKACRNYDTITITVDPQLICRAGPDIQTCPGLPVTIGETALGGVPPYTYQWEPADGIANPALPIVTVNPKTTTLYRLKVTDANDCEATDWVTVVPVPTVIASIASDTVICRGQTVRLGGTISGGKKPYLVHWTRPELLSDSSAINPLAAVDSTTTFIVTVLDSVGCSFTDSVTVTVTELPKVQIFASGRLEFCESDSVMLSTEPGFYRYIWSTGDESPTLTVRKTGMYGVQAYTADGCVALSDSVRITVHEPPELSVFGPVSVCVNSISTYYFKPVPPGYSYQWNVAGGTVNSNSGNSVSVKWDGGVPNGLVSLTITDNRVGCSYRIEYPVAVSTNLQPVISLSNGPVTCAGDSIVLNAGLGYASYAWSTGEQTPSIVVRENGVFYVNVTDSSGCSGSSEPVTVSFVEVTVPDLSIVGDTVFCKGDSVLLIAPPGYRQYSWSNGTTDDTCIVHLTGDYFVIVTDAIGCTGTSNSVHAQRIEIPDNAISGPAVSCINVSARYSTVQVPGLSFHWSCTGGTILTDPSLPQVDIRWNSAGLQRVTLDVQSGAAYCPSIAFLDVDVNANFRISIQVSGNPVFCSDTGVVLSVPNNFVNYRWSNGATSESVRVTETGSYWLTLEDKDGCPGISDTVQVTALPSPKASILPAGPITVCEGDSVVLTSEYKADWYRWSNGATTESLVVRANGVFTLTTESSNGCTAVSQPVQVSFDSAPRPEIAGPATVCEGTSAVYAATAHNGSAYSWQSNGGTITSGQGTNTVTVTWPSSGAGSLSVTETTPGGCEGSSTPFAVTVLPAPAPAIARQGDTLDAGLWYDYQWNRNGALIPGATGQLLVLVQPGEYTVTVTDANGCRATSGPVRFDTQISTVIALPALKAKPGERVRIPVVLVNPPSFIDSEVGAFTGELQVNSSLLAPVGATPDGIVSNGVRAIPIGGSKRTGNDTLASYEFMAMLGNAETAAIVLTQFVWDNPLVIATPVAGSISVEICREDGPRLFSDTGTLRLMQNSPNPYNTTTVISFELIETGRTRLTVLDMAGREVARLIDAEMMPGIYSVYFDAAALPSGSYIYLLTTPTAVRHRIMKLMK